jgi:adenosylcobyric acid synthase
MRNGVPTAIPDGAVDETGAVVGTMIHGLFANRSLREGMIGWLRRRKGMQEQLPIAPVDHGEAYDRLAQVVRANLDLSLISTFSRRLGAP